MQGPDDDLNATEWETTRGGGMLCAGITGGITGRPANAALIVDDPVKNRAEAESATYQQAGRDFWSSTAVSRMAPGTPALLVQTRWSPKDLGGHLLETEGRVEDGGQWTVIHLEALCTGKHPDPLRRTPGQPLTHPRLADSDSTALLKHWHGKRASSLARDWEALYQGNPRPSEGALITAELLARQHHFAHRANPVLAAVAVDPSGGGRDTAGIVGGYLDADTRLYVTDDLSGVMPTEQWAKLACELAARLDADRIIVEKNFGGDMAKLVIRTAWDGLDREGKKAQDAARAAKLPVPDNPYDRLPPRIVLVSAKRSKLLRAEPIAQQMTEDRFRFAAHLPELEAEWLTWQPVSTDSPGRIDASVYLGYGLLKVPGAGDVISSAADVDRNTVVERPGGLAARQIPRERPADGPGFGHSGR